MTLTEKLIDIFVFIVIIPVFVVMFAIFIAIEFIGDQIDRLFKTEPKHQVVRKGKGWKKIWRLGR